MKKRFFSLQIIIVALLININSHAQIDTFVLDQSSSNKSLVSIFKQIESEFKVKIFYNYEDVNFIVEDSIINKNQKLLLSDFLNKNNLSYSTYRSHIFITKGNKIETEIPENFKMIRPYGLDRSGDQENSANKNKYISNVRSVGEKNYDNKNTAVISTIIRFLEDSIPLKGIILRIEGTDIAKISDKNGLIRLTLDKGVYQFELTGSEIESTIYEVHVLSDGKLELFPERTIVNIQEVTIFADKYHNVNSMIMGFEELSSLASADIASPLGENDLVKAGLLLPGVQSVGEGNAGINVRGTPSDQNMFYVNDLPVYNTSHFLGFFSSFNPLSVQNVNIYKSSIPVQYGNNLSSVFDINLKNGSPDRFSFGFNVSPITVSAMIEGPIIKKKLHYLVSYRTSYSNWILKQITKLDINKSKAEFQDFTAKINFKANAGNNINLLVYYSNDNINFAGRNQYEYQTKGVNLSWNKTIAKKHLIHTNLIYSNYNFTESNLENTQYSYELPFKLDHFGLNSKINLLFHKHKINIGTDNILYMIDQGAMVPASDSSFVLPRDFYKENAFLSSLYVSDHWEINNNFSILASVRLNMYSYLGERTINIYEAGLDYQPTNVVDTAYYGPFERIKTYFHPDIRVTANYRVNDQFSIKAGYSNMYQYLFMMTNTISASPTNKFKLTDQYLEPINGQQFNLGIYSNLDHNKYALTLEGYYKLVNNFKDFKDGANLVFSEEPEYDIVNSNMNAYGIEFMIKKNYGKLNGWLNYSYSRSIVKNTGSYSNYNINLGNPYPSNFDKPHSINFVANYKIKRRITVSSNIVYSTGRPLTYPVAIYYQYGLQIPFYTSRNKYRIPDYFRVDISARMEGNLKKDKLAHGTWIFSVYNLTGRNNTYSVFFKTEEGFINGYRMSVFAIPIFSISYQLKYGNYADKYY